MNLFKKFDEISITRRIRAAFSTAGAPALEYTARDGSVVSAKLGDVARAASTGNRSYAVGSAKSVTLDSHDGRIGLLDTLTGSVVTLPAATGSGARFKFLISTVATSNSHKIQVANSSDTMTGMLMGVSDDPATVKGWTADATAGADTITLNRSTTGGTVKGEWVELVDIAANKWAVSGCIAQTGTEATPFSSAV